MFLYVAEIKDPIIKTIKIADKYKNAAKNVKITRGTRSIWDAKAVINVINDVNKENKNWGNRKIVIKEYGRNTNEAAPKWYKKR